MSPPDPRAIPGASAASSSGVDSEEKPEVRWRGFQPKWLRWLFGEERLFLVLAVIIGVLSGLSVVCFQIAIEWTRIELFGPRLNPRPANIILVPVAGGVVVALLVLHVFRRVRGSGVNQTKSAVYIYDGYIPFSTVIGKFVTCALAIGSGQSLGPEDPSLQMGAGIASALGRRLRLSREKVRLIAPVGAAAGLAAAFNAPISAVLFVLEEVIGSWSAGVLGGLILAAGASVIVLRLFLGSQPLFRVPPYQPVHAIGLLAYAALGVIGGGISLLFGKLIGVARPRLKALPRWTQYFQPAAAGLLVGLIALGTPQVLGAGYEIIDQALHSQFTWRLLILLALAKLVATTISFVSGTPGGMFAPTLFVGAMLGGAVGGAAHLLFPNLGGSTASFALVGMGTLFAGFLRVPMTSVFMVLELTGNYQIIVPVMISNTIAYLICRRFQPISLFDMLSRQDGVDLPSMEELREQAVLRIEDAMHSADHTVLKGDEQLSSALARVDQSDEEFFLLDHSHGAWSGVSKTELHRLAEDGSGELPLGRAVTTPLLPVLHPDQTLDAALRHLGSHPVLPVVHRADFGKLEGVVSLKDILRAYENSRENGEG